MSSRPLAKALEAKRVADVTALSTFSRFFKGYMGVMPVFVAALAPVLTLTRVIPVYQQQRFSLATFAGLLGFLLVAWVFYLRHHMARALFRGKTVGKAITVVMSIMPLMLIAATVWAYADYNSTINKSVAAIRVWEYQRSIGPVQALLSNLKEDPEKSMTILALSIPKKQIISRTDALLEDDFPLPYSTRLMFSYLGIFVFAELAFVLMALREYLQTLLSITDERLIMDHQPDESDQHARERHTAIAFRF
jgi:hypothetical protein